jgi:RHS repeat-associated protein
MPLISVPGAPSRSVASRSRVVQRLGHASAVVLPVVLVATLLQVPALAALAFRPDAVPHEASVAGVSIQPGKAAGGQTVPLVGARPAPEWPAPGTALLDLTTPADTEVSGTAGTAQVRARRMNGATDKQPSRVRVAVLDQAQAKAAGRHGVLIRVSGADSAPTDGRVSIGVNYSTFRGGAGADWSSRLRLVQLPECALSSPDAPQCQPVPLPSRNDPAAATVTAEVNVAVIAVDSTGTSPRLPDGGATSRAVPTSTLMALEAGVAGGAGSYAATSLSPSSTWSAGGSTGGFNWNYPMHVPPGLGGPVPSVSLSYSSQSVDGRTAASNNQPSWIGEGFDYSPGSIERRYKACTDDMGGNATNATKTGDLCWGTDNAVLSLNGSSVELIKDNTTGAWRPRNDDGSKIEKLAGASNGDNDGEYWKVTTADGTQYYFGRNRLDGWTSGKPVTNSTWTVPVFGNNPGEPCAATPFTAAWCQQAWRWNLDHVIDTHGNTMSYWYATETNLYARNLNSANTTTYIRGGYPTRIDYGTHNRSGTDTTLTGDPAARVVFTVADRCSTTGSACDSAVQTNWANWPDTPWDLRCTTSPCTSGGPSFWTSKRLQAVTTQVLKAGALSDVESWNFNHNYPDPGDGTRAGLWLASIGHTGHVGGTATVPNIVLNPIQLNNRVDTTRYGAAMHWSRLGSITTESGASVTVTYSQPDCVAGTRIPTSPDSNTYRCFPIIWTPDGYADPVLDWFHKYVVTQVVTTDTTGATPGVNPPYNPNTVTTYTYLGAPAWHYDDDDGLVPLKYKTWSQWRGYARVGVSEGSGTDPKTYSETLFFRGMDGDRLSSGAPRSVQVTASATSTAPAVTDADAFAGQARETIAYLGTGGAEISATVSDPWQSAPTSTRTINTTTVTARYIGIAGTHSRALLDGGRGYQRTDSSTTFDAYGRTVTTETTGDVAATGDESCTRITYPPVGSVWRLDLPSRQVSYALPCAQTVTTTDLSAADLISDERTSYDGAAWNTAVSKGDVTQVETHAGFSGGVTSYRTDTKATYDAYGRPLEAWDPLGNRTTSAYTPAADGPVTRIATTNVLGWTSTVELDPAWGATTGSSDINGARSDLALDPLGRITGVWLPGRSKAANPNLPNLAYTYDIRTNAPTVITTKKLNAAGAQVTSYTLYDALMRPRQEQSPSAVAGGRLISDTFYDSAGRAVKTYSGYYNSAPPSNALFAPSNASLVASQTRVVYDAASRVTATILQPGGVEKWRTGTYYGGDHTDSTPPGGAGATSVRTDALGRTTELRQYRGGTVVGTYDATRYAFDRKGQLSTVTDAAGNKWTRGYDLRGHVVRTEDPDAGVTTIAYNDKDQVASTTDARTKTLAFSYDTLGREVGVFDGAVTGTQRIGYTYDTAPLLPDTTGATKAKGQLSSTTRWSNGNAYSTAVLGYTEQYRPTGTTTTIPSVEGGLAGAYTFKSTYNVDGSLATSTYPAKGGLGLETVAFGYSPLGQLTTAKGTSTYVTGTTYSELGQLLQYIASTGTGGSIYRSYTYEAGTGRVATAKTQRSAVSPTTVADLRYSYTDAGTITKIANLPTGGQNDTQCFTYDHQRRLTEAWTPTSGDCAPTPTNAALGGPAPYWHSWTFDTTGNRLKEVKHATTAGDATSTYTYPATGQPRPHTVTGVTTVDNNGTRSTAYTYDQAGNTLTRPATAGQQTLTWDSEGRVATVTGNGGNGHVYDVDGNRLISRDAAGATLYLPNTEIRLSTATGQVTATRYYDGPDGTCAQRTASGVTWIVDDHQGTGQTAITATNQAATQRRFDAYGNLRGTNPTWVNTHGFVDGISDPTGTTHLGAREYDPSIGRFLSVDPLVDFGHSEMMNGYTYANNDPITSSDPSGLAACYARDPDDLCPGNEGTPSVAPDTPAASPTYPATTPYCHNHPNEPSCRPSRKTVGIFLGPSLIVAPSEQELHAAIEAEMDKWCNGSSTTAKVLAGAGLDGCTSGTGASDTVENEVRIGICAEHPDWCELQDVSDTTLVDGVAGVGYSAFGTTGKTRRAPHSATLTMYDAQGNFVARADLKSGNMTAAERAKGYPQGPLDSHTEARATVMPVTKQAGAFIVLEGVYPPCSPCKGKMREHAEQHKVTWVYRWSGKVWVATPEASGWRYNRNVRRAAR